jgi:hypothetical protein
VPACAAISCAPPLSRPSPVQREGAGQKVMAHSSGASRRVLPGSTSNDGDARHFWGDFRPMHESTPIRCQQRFASMDLLRGIALSDILIPCPAA